MGEVSIGYLKSIDNIKTKVKSKSKVMLHVLWAVSLDPWTSHTQTLL